jgi:hypothetical protein
MKRMVLTVIIVICAAALYGQKNSLDDFFNSYSDRDGYTSVIINGNLFGLLKNIDDDPDLARLDHKITSIRVLSREKHNTTDKPDFMSELKDVIKRGGYEEMMTVKSSDDDLLFLVKTDRDTIKEILVIASGDNDAVIQIRGNLTEDDVDCLSANHAEGLARLDLLENSGK